MSTPLTHCTECTSAIPLDAPGGMCPACELRMAMELPEGTGDGEILGTLGGCELLAEIGRGGMGAVWKARQPGLGRMVAIKILPGGEWAGAAARMRFQREAEAAASLRHPHIVAVHDCGEHEGTLWYSMDWIDGTALNEKLASGGMPAREAAVMMEQLARAVHYAHSEGIWHRDLKPANILVDREGQPHITDFGLARTQASTGLTVSGHIAGSPHYLPPERAAGSKDAPGAAGDIYALGATLYHMLTGQPPFRAADVAAVLAKVTTETPPRPSSIRPGVPRDLETVCFKCMEKAPAARYATAEELADDLSRFLRHEPVRARPVSGLVRLLRWSQRRPALAALSGALILATAGLIAVLALSARRATAHARSLADALETSRSARQTAESASTAAQRDVLIAESARSRKGWLFHSWSVGMSQIREAIRLHHASGPRDAEAARRLRDELAAALAMPVTDAGEPSSAESGPFTYWADRERRWIIAPGEPPYPYRLRAADGSRTVGLPARHVHFSVLSASGGRYLQTQYWASPAPESDVWDLSGEIATARTIKGQLACWSPDGKLAVRWEAGRWSIWNAETGADRPGGEVTFIHSAAWRPGGGSIAICSQHAGTTTLTLYSSTSLQPLWQQPVFPPLVTLTWNDDGSQLAGMDRDGRIHSRCGDRGISGHEMLEPGGPPWESPLTGIQFAPGGLLVSHAKSGTCTVWDTASGTLLRSELMAISASMEAGRRADGALGPIKGRNDTARWLKVKNGIWRHASISLNNAAGPLNALHWSPDSRHLAACGIGVCLWDAAAGSLTGDIFPASIDGGGLAWTSTCAVPLGKGGLLAAYGSGLWRSNMPDMHGRTIGLCIRPHTASDKGILARAAESGHIAAATRKEDPAVVEFFHPDTPKDVRSITLPGPATALALTPDGTILAAAYSHAEHQLRLYNTNDGSVRFTQHNMGIAPRAVQFGKGGHQLAFNSCNAHVLETHSLQTLGNFSTWSRVDSLAATPAVTMDQAGKWFAVTDPPRRIILHRAVPQSTAHPAGWENFITLESPSGIGLTRLSLSPDGNHLAAATTGPSFEMWDLAALEAELKASALWVD